MVAGETTGYSTGVRYLQETPRETQQEDERIPPNRPPVRAVLFDVDGTSAALVVARARHRLEGLVNLVGSNLARSDHAPF